MIGDSIWIVSDYKDCENDYIFQLVSKAYELGNYRNTIITVIYFGQINQEHLENVFQYGADKILIIEHIDMKIDEKISILEEMINKYKPTLLMFSDSREDKNLAASLSVKYECGLTADCINIEINNEGTYIFSRAALNNSVIAHIKCINSIIQMCTVKRNVFNEKIVNIEPIINIEKYEYEKQKKSSRYSGVNIINKEELQYKVNNFDWQSSKIMFAVGRGVSDLNTLDMIRRLAEKYDAELIGTRGAVEEGLIDKSRQVGQSGYSVSPDVYIGFGVSGACQHIVGIKNSKLIIAINNDKNANICKYANYIIIEDIKAILNELLRPN